ncbi:LacI family DNA-binding transcriptional regulator [Celerinatantimonas sp. YJH-8]|uniref:LacI family DNA-binding transcriptional regulator n=1 Tax=Celerinatantimonas sp. YJH-8 TaxID=3228714 RepID=UPI0038CB040B
MATIKQIAQQAGVAASTVSRVLSHDITLSVSKEKRQRIEQIAKQLGYLSPTQRKQQQNTDVGVVARSHFQTPSMTDLHLLVVHFLTPTQELNDPYFTSIRIGIENRCHHFNIGLRSSFTNNLPSNMRFMEQAQGVICVGHFSLEHIQLIRSINRNLIFIDSNPLPKLADAVTFDRKSAAREIVRYIIESGAKRPAFIGNQEDRLYVFRQMTQEAGIYCEPLCKISPNFCIDSGYQAMAEILDSPLQPDVVFAATDIIAIGVYRAIQERGIDIPGKIQVVGMNDIPTSQHLNPSLTTMRLYPAEMGEAAVDLFMELVEGRSYKKNVQLGFDMIWRESFERVTYR